MKKALLLTLAAGFVATTQLMATDVYITGSTAFRANVYNACAKMFNPPITPITLGGGAAASSSAIWTMAGTNISTLNTAFGANGRLVIHGSFTGSIQGLANVETRETIQYCDTNGVSITNTSTFAFSDSSSVSSPYPATGNYSEEQVAVQPFVMVKSLSVNPAMTNITNVSFEQLRYLIAAGTTPLSAWTGHSQDANTSIYLINRTKDSGTRRTTFANTLYGYNQSAATYIYDVTNNVFYLPSQSANQTVSFPTGGGTAGVIGTTLAGVNGDNLKFGPGYIGGGDIKSELGKNNTANLAVSYLSLADAQAISGSLAVSNWTQVVSLDGFWPTVAGPGIAGNSGTNDFSPIINGSYGNWGVEVVVYPTANQGGDQNITAAQVGNQTLPGTFLGVLDSQSYPSTPVAGSLENELFNGTLPNTAIPLNLMVSSRTSVGGTITP